MKSTLAETVRVGIILLVVSASLCCGQQTSLTILHTNDIHAGFRPHEAGWVQTTPKPMVGGFNELNLMVDSIRKVKGEVLMLDGGDVMTGTPISEFDYKSVTGGALFQMMNLVGYDAWTIGNHDLDISQSNLRELIQIAKFPTVSANLVDSAGNLPFGNREYVIIKKKGLRVGIIGLMSSDLFRLTNTNNLRGLKVIPPVEVTQKIIDKIDSETDLIVALTHQGVEDDSLLAIATHGLDVIIGGHSHTRLKSPKMVNGVVICQTGSNCENLGELSLTIENDRVTSSDGKLHALWVRHEIAPGQMADLVNEYSAKIDKDYGEKLGTLLVDLKRGRNGESNIGDFIADAIREGANADIGVTNSSGIRKDMAAGAITKLDLFEISPFRNYLCTFSVRGSEVRALVQRYLNSLIDGRTSIDFSGITCSWSRVDGKAQIERLEVGGAPLSDDKQYACATSDFVINQGDKYLGLKLPEVKFSSTTISQALVAKVRKDKTISSSETRFRESH